MNVFYNLEDLPEFKEAVITIGSFDGVHSGHQKIIQKVRQLAQKVGGESVIITFHPHPRLVVYPRDKSLKLITTIEEKVELFRQCGVDNLVVVPFTVAFSQQTADEYIQQFLVGRFKPRYIVIGYDHRFGLNRQGNIDYLKWHGEELGYEVVEIEKQEIQDIAVSSTKVRQALEEGDVKSAKQLLGHPFLLSGKVIQGQKIGRTIGFPTANIDVSDKHKLIPPYGIYAVKVRLEEKEFGGMLYIGDRPTLEQHTNQTIEVNIFEFSEDIYGKEITLEFVDFIRHDMRFDNLEGLQSKLAEDKLASQQALSANTEASDLQLKANAVIPEVAIVILNYNGQTYLKQFLPFVLESEYENLSIYVADNASTDNSKEVLSGFPDVKTLFLPKNGGFAQGYNEALEQIDADYYILLNSDVEVKPGWIAPIMKVFAEQPEVAVCQPKILSFHERTRFEYAGGSGGWIDKLGYPFCRGRIFGSMEEDEGQYDDKAEIFWASGAALFIKAPIFHQVGGFDPDYFAHAEEIDLCWRIKRAGYSIKVVPESVVYHVGGGTLNYDTPKKVYLNFRNTLYNIVKNDPISKILWLIPLRLVLDGLAGLLFLAQGKFALISSILKAHWSFFPKLPYTWKKRKRYQAMIDSIRIKPARRLTAVYPRSIVWQYYAQGRQKFKDLF
ncbi:MAG: bifunctional riboflavin kinase/FAD synthetase [Saprospiraceae bacterium]|nr:bifunctional riboflavin kinase/FAD synthetase [Saprospiraceae bacterium]